MSGADEGWLLRTVTAATGEDRAILLTTEGARPDSLLPPLNLAPGARLGQELKCCALEKAVKSGPIPGIVVPSTILSTPIIRCSA